MGLNYGASSAFYLILSLVIVFLAVGANKTRNLFFPAMIIAILTLVAGLRAYDVGTDTAEYVRIFEVLKNGGQIKEELGFAIISRILMIVFDNPTILFLIYSAIIYGLIILRILDFRDKISVGVAIFAFYSFFFFESLNIMRQFMAIAIVFWGSRYLSQRKYLKFCVSTLLATSIHSSAVLGFLYLVVEYMSWKDLDKKQRRFLIGLTALGIALSGYVLSTFNRLYNRYRHYFLVVNKNIGSRVLALAVIFVLSLIIYRYYSRNKSSHLVSSERYFLHTTRIYYVLACGLGLFGYFYDYMARVGFFFYPFVFIYFGYIIRERNTIPWLALKLMICVVIGYILYQYLFLVNGAGHHPYHVIWNI